MRIIIVLFAQCLLSANKVVVLFGQRLGFTFPEISDRFTESLLLITIGFILPPCPSLKNNSVAFCFGSTSGIMTVMVYGTAYQPEKRERERH